MDQDEHLVSKLLVTRKSNYKSLRSAVHHIPSVSVLQDKLTTYYDNLVWTYRNRAHFLRFCCVLYTTTHKTWSLKIKYHQLGYLWTPYVFRITDYYLRRLATPWKLINTAHQATTSVLIVASMALWQLCTLTSIKQPSATPIQPSLFVVVLKTRLYL